MDVKKDSACKYDVSSIIKVGGMPAILRRIAVGKSRAGVCFGRLKPELHA